MNKLIIVFLVLLIIFLVFKIKIKSKERFYQNTEPTKKTKYIEETEPTKYTEPTEPTEPTEYTQYTQQTQPASGSGGAAGSENTTVTGFVMGSGKSCKDISLTNPDVKCTYIEPSELDDSYINLDRELNSHKQQYAILYKN